MNLEDFGHCEWMGTQSGESLVDEAHLARVSAVDRDRYIIGSALGLIPAELTGRLLYCAETTEDMPCVGDWVLVDYHDNGSHAVVHDVLPRRSILRRRASGIRVDYQPIAANIDVAFIVQSCDVDYNLNRLDRYLAMTRDGGIEAALLLTKCDLIDEASLGLMTAAVRREHRIDVVPLSSATGTGYERLRDVLEKGKTYCLIGSSGVGKSSILNRLVGKEEFLTNPVREKSGKGRHTTTRRQLVILDNGALFVDTPGMRELGMLGFGQGIEESFDDIAEIAKRCRFADCTHTSEHGCAVLSSVEAGELTAERVESYARLRKESQYYEMTYLERRKKDRAFGKMVKDYMKHNKKH